MVPAIFALIVLTAGLILLHFGQKQLGTILAGLSWVATPYVGMPPAGAATK